MSFLVPEQSSSNTFLVAAGTHVATAFAVIGVGFQETTYGVKSRVFIGWEIHGHRFQWEKDGQSNDVPATIWRAYNVSMHKNSTLRIDIEAWRGQTLSKDEAKTFDLFEQVGKSCQITIEHAQVGDRTFGNVMAVNQLLSGTAVPPLESDEVRYLQPTHIADWNLVPEFLRKKIENQATEVQASRGSLPVTEDIPFKEDDLEDIGI
jgi:hypothetical protein